jgi:hypothetical protein
MIDPIKILKRAWHILWNYRTLWFFGLILALTASRGGGNSGYQFNGGDRSSGGSGFTPGGRIEQWFQEFFRPLTQMPEKQLISTLVWVVAGLICIFLLIGIVFAIARYVSEVAAIRMVNDYEESDVKVGFRQGWRLGWTRSAWRFFLINLLISLPVILLLLLLAIIGGIVYFMVAGGNNLTTVTGIVGGVGLAFLLIFLVVILEVVLHLLREFFWRVCALENLGVIDSLRRGFELVKRNWKSAGLMWLVMLGVGIARVIATILLLILLIPLYIVMAIPAILVAGVPALVAFGITSLFLSTPLAAIVALVIGLPLFFLITFSPLVVLEAWLQVFKSSVWTLTYRELLILEGPAAPKVLPQAA